MEMMEGRGRTLIRQISSECVHCVGFRWPKNRTFGQVLICWGLLYRPPFTDEGQIWCARADPRSTRTRQMSAVVVSCNRRLLRSLCYI